jgi:hypothetical protein
MLYDLVLTSEKSPETNELPPRYEPASVTELTTNILNRDPGQSG